MRGRKPKTIEQRIAEGNTSTSNGVPLPDPIEPGPLREAPDPPEHLDEDGVRFWEESIPALAELGMLMKVDMAALEMAAVAYSRFHHARRVIDDEGLLARGSSNQWVEHPAVATERKSQSMFLRFAEQYGLTSVARARLGIAILQGQSLQNDLNSQLGDTKLEKVK